MSNGKLGRQEFDETTNTELDAVVQHLNGEDGKQHIEVVAAIPEDLSTQEILFKVDGAHADVPSTITVDEIHRTIEKQMAKKVHAVTGVLATNYGAVGDYNPVTKRGTNNSPALVEALYASWHTFKTNKIIFPSGKYLFHDSITELEDCTLEGIGDVEFWFANNNDLIGRENMKIRNIKICGNAVILLNEPHSNVIVDEVKMDTKSTGVYLDYDGENAPKAKNLRITRNTIKSGEIAIDITNRNGLPEEKFRNTFINENIISTQLPDGEDAVHWFGFSLGIFSSHNLIILNNISETSYNEAVHIEDTQRHLLMGFNIFDNALTDGARLLYKNTEEDGGGEGNFSRPPIMPFNVYKQKDSAKTGIGIWHVFDGHGTIPYVNAQGSYIEGFHIGYFDGGGGGGMRIDKDINLDGTYITDCGIGLDIGNTQVHGTVIFNKVPTLIKMDNHGKIGRVNSIISQTPVDPKTAFDVSEDSLLYVNEYRWRVPMENPATGSTYTIIPFMKKPKYMKGRIVIQVENNYYDFTTLDNEIEYTSAAVSYDKESLTLTNKVWNSRGPVSLEPKINLDEDGEGYEEYKDTLNLWLFSNFVAERDMTVQVHFTGTLII